MASSITRLLGITATISGLLLFLALREPYLGGIIFTFGVIILVITLFKSRSENLSKTSTIPKTTLTEKNLDLNNLNDDNLDKLIDQDILSDAGLDQSKLSTSSSIQDTQAPGKGEIYDPNKQQMDMKKQWWIFNQRQQIQTQSQDMFKQQREMAQKQQEELRKQQEMRRRRQ